MVRYRSVRTGAACLVVALGACASSTPSATPVGNCPVPPRRIAVSVDQWRELVERLAGDCGDVTTILTTTADPHDFEPTPADIAALSDADVVVENGLGYDPWVDRSLAVADHRATVLDVGRVVGVRTGTANPHRWYRPADVHRMARAVTAELVRHDPRAGTYFRKQARRWDASMHRYDTTVAALRARHAGARYAATEGVFDLMAHALGLVNRTPTGYERAVSNESEPGPADLAAFESRVRSGAIDVFIDNPQTQGSIPDRLRVLAKRASVPVVEITESQPARFATFAAWQLDQLHRIDRALSR